MHPAKFAYPLGAGQVECQLCPHTCRLQPGQSGICQVRHNLNGTLVTAAYGRPIALAVEPIEKKYLFHVRPGSRTLSLGTAGCNLGCQYCINWRVSQRGVEAADPQVSAEEVMQRALQAKVDLIAFTYTEPTIYFEYAEAIADLARRAGLQVVAKSNGFMTAPVLEVMASWLTAINIDLKGWQADGYQRTIKGSLSPVLATLKLAKRLGLWLEVSTLITPEFNTDAESLRAIAHFISQELGPETPWHIQRFFPNYQMLERATTAQAQLQLAYKLGQEAGLHHIYCKELAHGDCFQTRCPHCHSVVIERQGFQMVRNHLQAGRCAVCGMAIAGNWTLRAR